MRSVSFTGQAEQRYIVKLFQILMLNHGNVLQGKAQRSSAHAKIPSHHDEEEQTAPEVLTSKIKECSAFEVDILRTSSLQSNTLFHLGAFMLPFDGGIMNRFTCYMLKDTEFTGRRTLFPPRVIRSELFSAERILQVVHDYKPAFYMAGPYHVQAVSCLVRDCKLILNYQTKMSFISEKGELPAA